MSSRDTVSIYRRRPLLPRNEKKEKEEEKENQSDAIAQAHTAKNSRTRKGRASWIDRSLSSRSNINNLSSSRHTVDKAKQTFSSPNVYRKKRVEAPANFVREQKSYFEQVDAFELEEEIESPHCKDHWVPELPQKDAVASSMHLYNKGLLQAVQEDSLEELPNDNSTCSLSLRKDPLRRILETPQSVQSLQKLESRGSLICSKQGLAANQSVVTEACHDAHARLVTKEPASEVWCKSQPLLGVPAPNFLNDEVQEAAIHRRRSARVEQLARCKALVTPKKPYPIIVLSDNENENIGAPHRPGSVSQSKHVSRQTQETRARQNISQVIVLDDSPLPPNKDCKTHPNVASVKCDYGGSSSIKGSATSGYPVKVAQEVATELKTSAQNVHLHPQADQRLVEQIKKLDVQAYEDENYVEFSKFSEHCVGKEQFAIPKTEPPCRAKQVSTYEALLQKCGQTTALPLEEAIMQFSGTRDVVKLGEGTYGEAFRTSNLVLKIVPMGGTFRVNGEVQKTLAEMHTEMLLMLTLNRFRKDSCIDLAVRRNVCNNFIETKMVKVCQGFYGQTLIKAWEEWDIKHESENDHPKVFPENQLYMLFVLADGGKDLESFSINSFDVARSILIQVTAALAVAEEDCEFEHRDLHWGNILVAPTKSNEIYCKLDGREMRIRTCGVLVNIIDFTLSRLFTGKEVLFSDLSDDPLLFQGPKGDIQAEVYRKMLHLTEGQWDKRYLKTNCFWIHYLVDILLTRKKVPLSNHESRTLRAFKKRVLVYDSAQACLQDQFFACV